MKKYLSAYFRLSPFWVFAPFLAVFVVLVLRLHTDSMEGDEGRYIQFAQNLWQGFYSPPAPNINLWNGPGYPLFLMPLVGLGLPLLVITLCNAIFQYLSIVYLYKTLRIYTSHKRSLWVAFFWASYYIAYQEMPAILSEPLAALLGALVAYSIAQSFQTTIVRDRYAILSGLFIGFWVLVKVIFGYVLLLLLAGCGLYRLLSSSVEAKKLFFIAVVAFMVNVPYLVYTHSLTARLFYWSNSGGMSLYWMSTPYTGEFGDWNNEQFTANCGNDALAPCNAELLARNHAEDMAYVTQLTGIAKDDAYKAIALRNIKAAPAKYAQNVVANIGRLFFGFPTSYFYQRESTLLRLPPNCILFTLLIFSGLATLYFFASIRSEIKFLFCLAFLYLLFSSIVSAYPRQLYVIVPVLLVWIAYILDKTVAVKWQIEG